MVTEFVSLIIESMENSSTMDATLFIQFHPMCPVCSMACVGSSVVNKKCTLLIKSAAYNDHPGGTYYARIWTCLLRIWSRIYFLLRPLYGLRPNINSYAMIPTA